MTSLARFIAGSRYSAALVVGGSVLLPLIFWLSAPALGLMTLRRGVVEGALVTAMAAVLVITGLTLSGGRALDVWLPLMVLWIPMLGAGGALRATRTWSAALQTLAGFFTLGLLVFYAVVGDVAAFWSSWLARAGEQMRVTGPQAESWQRFQEVGPELLTGSMFASALGLAVVSLLLARWWQARLYNPGGLAVEFVTIRLPRWFAVLAAVTLLAGALQGQGLVFDAGLLLSGVFAVQGLAVIHRLARERALGVGWLIALYVLMPLLLRLIAVLGMIDVFMDLRRRYTAGDEGPKA